MQVLDSPSPSISHISLQTSHPHPKIKPMIAFKSNPKSPYSPPNIHLRTKQINHLTAYRYLSDSSNRSWFSTLINSKSILHFSFSDYIKSLESINRIDFIFRKLQLFQGLTFTLIHPKPEELQKTFKILSHSFVKIHYLISFSFELMSSSKPSEKLLRKLSSILQTMKNLRYLRISFFSEKDVSENILSLILKENLQKLKSLSTLSLKLVNASMDNQEMEFLYNGLTACKSLVNIDIDLFDCPNLTNEGIKKLFFIWRDLNLNCLKVKLRVLKNANQVIVYKDFDSLMSEEEQALSDFSVVSKYDGRGQKTTLKLVREDPKMKRSRAFELFIFQKKRFEREVLLDFPSSKYITTLCLNICDYDANGDLLSKLTKSFNRMESLESLTLEIEASPKLGDFNAIIRLVRILKSLKILQFKFKGFSMVDQQVGDLFQMTSLGTLDLDLSECKASSTIFEIFGELNSSISNLTELKLAFAEGLKERKERSGFLASFKRIFPKEEENKRGIEEFWRFLKSLKELQSLNLKLRNIDFSKKDQREFSNGLCMLQNLRDCQAKFEFDYVEKEKLKILDNLIVKPGKICYLRTLKLQFKEEKDTAYEKDVRIFDCKIPGCGFSFQLKLSFRKCYNEARKEIALLQNLTEFVKKIGAESIEKNWEQRIEALCLICVDDRELEFIEVRTPADQSPEILGKLVKVILLEGPKLQKYSLKIHSKNITIE